jgi:hypothetical protein
MIQPEGPTTFYIAGPMTGIEEYNFPAFDNARDMLHSNGLVAISPADMDRELGYFKDGTFNENLALYMRRDLEQVAKADGILMLEGWEASRGSNIELMVALICNLVIWVEVRDTEDNLQVIEARPTPDIFMAIGHILALNTEGGF